MTESSIQPFWNRRPVIIIGLVVVIAVAAVAWFWGRPALLAKRERDLRARIAENAQTSDALRLILRGEERMAADPQNVEGYLTAGLGWKTAGEVLGDRALLERAREIYERGTLLFGDANSLVLLNAGSINRVLGDFARAEKYYLDAFSKHPAVPEIYLELTDLYRYHLGKEPSEVLRIFQFGLERVLENALLVQRLAFYLEELGRYRDALSYFEILAEHFPGQFEAKVAELKDKIAAE